jgi:hypothetical protein
MGITRIFSKSVEMKRFFVALEEMDLDVLAHFSSVREFLKAHIRTEANATESRETIIRLMKDGVDPKITAYLFARVLLEDLLLDGEHHALRGRLTPDGENFFAVYNNVIRELRVHNWFSSAQADVHYQTIRNGIAVTVPAHVQNEARVLNASTSEDRDGRERNFNIGRPVPNRSLVSARNVSGDQVSTANLDKKDSRPVHLD